MRYVQITAFKPFFVSLTLPYSTKRGEEFALQATVFNYLSTPLQVNIVCLWLAVLRAKLIAYAKLSVLQFHFIIYYFSIRYFME